MLSAEQVVAAARETAKAASASTAWNYDHIECVALTTVAQAFTDFANLIENAITEGEPTK